MLNQAPITPPITRNDAIDSRGVLQWIKDELRNKTFRYFLFFVISACILLFCSQNSFLYSINTSVDVNCFVTSGRLMLNGKIPYKDFFEQKGVIVYLVHEFILFLLPMSYHGLYLLEVFCATIYLIYNYKLLKLFFHNSEKELLLCTVLSSCFVYTSSALSSGGEIEEYALPLYSYLLYNTAKLILRDETSIKTYLTIGVHVGIIFWSKYFALLLHGICFIFLLVYFIKKKNFGVIKKMFLYCTIGFICVTIPVLIYFIYNNAVSQMIDVYFYTNIFEYSASEDIGFFSLFFAIVTKYLFELYQHCSISILILFFIFNYCFDTKRKINSVCEKYADIPNSRPIIIFFAIAVRCFFWGTLIISRKEWTYYQLPIFSLFPFVYMIFYNSIKKHITFQKIFSCIVTASFAWAIIYDSAILHCHDISCQQKIIDVINSDPEPKSVMVFDDMDSGYFMATGYLPDDYYFTRVNARKKEISQHYLDLIESRSVDYIICSGVNLDFELFNMPKFFRNSNFEAYYNKMAEGTNQSNKEMENSGYKKILEISTPSLWCNVTQLFQLQKDETFEPQ